VVRVLNVVLIHFFRKVLNRTFMHLQNVEDIKNEININKINKVRKIS